jgi:hypothetical protein
MTVTLPHPEHRAAGRHHEFPPADMSLDHSYGNGRGAPVTLHGSAGAGMGQPVPPPPSHPPEPTPVGGPAGGLPDAAVGVVRDASAVGYDVDAAMLRGAVVGRMRRFNVLHADHAWRRRYRDPIAAHGMAFLYADPEGTGWWSLRTATRLVLDAPEVARAELMLHGLIEAVHELAPGGPVDPRVDMANRCDRMTDRAVFIGVGLSTLDTPVRPDPHGGPDLGGPWTTVRKTADGVSSIAGRCYMVLTDGAAMVLDRGRYTDPEPVRLRSTHMVHGHTGWGWLRGVTDHDTGPGTAVVWHQLAELRNVLMGEPRAVRVGDW